MKTKTVTVLSFAETTPPNIVNRALTLPRVFAGSALVRSGVATPLTRWRGQRRSHTHFAQSPRHAPSHRGRLAAARLSTCGDPVYRDQFFFRVFDWWRRFRTGFSFFFIGFVWKASQRLGFLVVRVSFLLELPLSDINMVL